ncbi:MAG: HIT family protein [Acholeplasmataceae bacterium]|nr:MAG: HIT family protein [Acholeplasmataceae bacterium]
MASVFTKIIKREIPAHIVYEDDKVIAFLDIIQTTPGHVLVACKHEYQSILDLPEEEAAHLFAVTTRLAKAVQQAFQPAGINLVSNNGAQAGQTVFHFHIHLIPRYPHDDIKIQFKNRIHETHEDDYLERARRIRQALT